MFLRRDKKSKFRKILEFIQLILTSVNPLPELGKTQKR